MAQPRRGRGRRIWSSGRLGIKATKNHLPIYVRGRVPGCIACTAGNALDRQAYVDFTSTAARRVYTFSYRKQTSSSDIPQISPTRKFKHIQAHHQHLQHYYQSKEIDVLDKHLLPKRQEGALLQNAIVPLSIITAAANLCRIKGLSQSNAHT